MGNSESHIEVGEILETPYEHFVVVCITEWIVFFGTPTKGYCMSMTTGRRYVFINSRPNITVGDFSVTRRPYNSFDDEALKTFFERLKSSQANDTHEGRRVIVQLDSIIRQLSKPNYNIGDEVQDLFSTYHPRCFNH